MIYSNVELKEHQMLIFADKVLDTLDSKIRKGENGGQIELGYERSFVHREENPDSNYILLRFRGLPLKWKFRQFFPYTARESQEFLRYSIYRYDDDVEYLFELSKDIDMAFCVPDGTTYRIVMILDNKVSEFTINEYADKVGRGELPNLLRVIWKHDILVPSRACVQLEPDLLRKPNTKLIVSKYVITYLNNPGLIKTMKCPKEIKDAVFTKVLNYIYKRGYFYLYLDEESIEIIGKEKVREVFMSRYDSGEHPLYEEDETFLDKYVK